MTAFPLAILTYTLRQINYLPHTNDEDIGGDISRSRNGNNSSILVNNQPDAQFFFRVYLFQFSTCFEHPCAYHQENQLY